MLFSSPVFLFLFLPLTLLGYYLSPKSVKNYWLLLASLIFFAWGGVSYTIILIVSIILNYLFGLALGNSRRPNSKKWLSLGVACNVVILGVFKYANFITENLNSLFTSLNLTSVSQTDIILPVGISFYTFHAVSYLVDIYRGKTSAQKNIFDLALYISMFSQLIAGPIIRYSDVWLQLRNREHDPGKFASGVERFLIGLGKKVLLANTFAGVADPLFNTNPAEYGILNAWLAIVCYTLQIYCDFAGYSDMAIGLGRMFGFDFMENFNFPYMATSIKDFWRRWHISLSTFFRDYVYISLGGNKVKTARVYLNLLIVFFLTGFWHGASWTFVLWGFIHGFFMIIERLGFEKILMKIWSPLAHLYTLMVVMLAWVLFRAGTFEYALTFWSTLFDFDNIKPEMMDRFFNLFNSELVFAFIVSILGAAGVFKALYEFVLRVLQSKNPWLIAGSYFYHVLSICFYGAVFILCTMYLIAGTYNPFIYYQF
jgi:alginate O-acetyltransferase complex protein AlgI